MSISVSKSVLTASRQAFAARSVPVACFASSSRVRLDSVPTSSSPSNPPTTPTSRASTIGSSTVNASSNPFRISTAPSTRGPGPAGRTPLAPRVPTSSPSSQPQTKLKFRPFNTTPETDYPFTLTVSSTRNNTLLTFADITGPLVPSVTAGSDKTFKKSARASYEAAHQAAMKMFERILEYVQEHPVSASALATRGQYSYSPYGSSANSYAGLGSGSGGKMKVVFRGLSGGQGRDAVASAFDDQDEIRRLVGRVEDRTPLKIGGTRARKPRRL